MHYVYPALAKANKIAKKYGVKVYSASKYPYKLRVVYKGKSIYIGHREYTDNLLSPDPKRRKRYRARHAGDYINDKSRAGFWSYWILWA